jgi:endonuclease/exonuclease/phosphatase (EEP) superfamily protein YafD
MAKLMKLIWNIVLLMGAMVSFALGLALQGGRVNTHLDMLNHFAPGIAVAQLLWLAVIASGSGIIRKICITICICGVFLTSFRLTPEIAATFATPRSQARTGRTVRVLDWNVWVKNTAPKASADLIRSYDPDVITLQEADGPAAAIPAALKQSYPHVARCRGCDLYILSRWPLRRWGAKDENWDHGSGRPATVVWAEVVPPGQAPFSVLTTHYDHPNTKSRQAVQRAYLAALLTKFDPQTTLLAADMNLTPWAFAMDRQDAAMPVRRVTRALASWPARFERGNAFPMPLLPIDHIYAGSAWKVVSVERGARGGSDHYPVIATLTR